jgi:hypothetical protein
MIERCENPNATGYHRYGGRGISICERWRRSFEHFLEDMGPRPQLSLQLDRIDNNGNYEPSNCRWATVKQQANNRRQREQRVFLTFDGQTRSLSEWAEVLGVSVGTIHMRRWKRSPLDKVLSPDLRTMRSRGAG